MGNLDWGSKFSLDMSQNRGERKKFHPVQIWLLTNKSPFLIELTKIQKMLKKN